jgi:5-(carboxyamino)imidazole ribonucleotide synthase
MALLPAMQARTDVSVHLYGKETAREGRKMGHANRLFPLGMLSEQTEAELLGGV